VIRPRLTTIRQPVEQMANEAATMLIQGLRNTDGLKARLLDFALVERESAGPFKHEGGDKFSLYLIGEYFASRGVGSIFDITYLSTAPGSANNPSLAADGVTPGPRNFRGVTDAPNYRDLDTGGGQATATYSFDSGLSLTNTLAWKFYDLNQQLDSDFTGGNATNINSNKSHFDQFSNELRLALPSDNALSGQVGLYYCHSQLHQDAQVAGNAYLPSFVLPTFPFCVGAVPATPSPPNCSVSNVYFYGRDSEYTTKSTSYAAFCQLTYSLSDQFKLIAGGRYTHDRVSIDLAQIQQKYFLPLGVANATYDQHYSSDHFSWKLGAQWRDRSKHPRASWKSAAADRCIETGNPAGDRHHLFCRSHPQARQKGATAGQRGELAAFGPHDHFHHEILDPCAQRLFHNAHDGRDPSAQRRGRHIGLRIEGWLAVAQMHGTQVRAVASNDLAWIDSHLQGRPEIELEPAAGGVDPANEFVEVAGRAVAVPDDEVAVKHEPEAVPGQAVARFVQPVECAEEIPRLVLTDRQAGHDQCPHADRLHPLQGARQSLGRQFAGQHM
jgi:hypothetical protein